MACAHDAGKPGGEGVGCHVPSLRHFGSGKHHSRWAPNRDFSGTRGAFELYAAISEDEFFGVRRKNNAKLLHGEKCQVVRCRVAELHGRLRHPCAVGERTAPRNEDERLSAFAQDIEPRGKPERKGKASSEFYDDKSARICLHAKARLPGRPRVFSRARSRFISTPTAPSTTSNFSILTQTLATQA